MIRREVLDRNIKGMHIKPTKPMESTTSQDTTNISTPGAISFNSPKFLVSRMIIIPAPYIKPQRRIAYNTALPEPFLRILDKKDNEYKDPIMKKNAGTPTSYAFIYGASLGEGCVKKKAVIGSLPSKALGKGSVSVNNNMRKPRA